MMESGSARSSARASLYRQEVRLDLSSDSLEEEDGDDCDTDSLSEERRYQTELQRRIDVSEESLPSTQRVHHGVGADIHGYKLGAESNMAAAPHQDLRSTPQTSSRSHVESSYSELRYDPNWRRNPGSRYRSLQDEDLAVESPRYSDLLSPDLIDHITHNNDPSEVRREDDIKSQQHIKTYPHQKHATKKPDHDHRVRQQGMISGTVEHQHLATTTKLDHHQPTSGNARIGDGMVHHNHATAKTDQDHRVRGHTRVTGGTAHQKAALIQDKERRDIIEKNKSTLGVRSQKSGSYLRMHKKRSSEEASDPNIINGEEVGTTQVKAVSSNATITTAVEERGHPKNRSAPTDTRKEPVSHKSLSSPGPMNEAHTGSGYPSHSGFSHVYTSAEEIPSAQNNRLVSWNLAPQELTIDHQTDGDWGSRIQTHQKNSGTSAGKSEYFHVGPISPPVLSDPTHSRQRMPFQEPPNMTATLSSNESTSSSHEKRTSVGNRKAPQKERHVEEKDTKKLIDYLKQEVKLGGIGPSYIISQERMEQLRQQKEYAKIIQERNRNQPVRARNVPAAQNDGNKGRRQKSLEYAKSIPRPQPPPPPRAPDERRAEAPARRAASYDSLFPHNKLLEELQARHEQEKAAAAAIRALHLL